MTLSFFAGDAPLWRFSVKSAAPLASGLGPLLIDWGGAQRWLRGEFPPAVLRRIADEANGCVTLFRGGDRRGEVNAPLSDVEQGLRLRLKFAFDPDGILNPGRLYSWL